MASTLVASLCAAPIKAEVVRIIKLNSCGFPVTGAEAQVTAFDSFTEVANSPQYEDGQRFLLKKASGAPCVNQKDQSFLNWLQQTVTLCSVDPAVLGLTTGARMLQNGSSVVIGAMFNDDLIDARYSMELWQPVAGSNACSAGGLQQYFYWVFPNMTDAKIQDWSQQNDTTNLAWQAISGPAPTGWTAAAGAAVTGAALGSTPAAYLGGVNSVLPGDHYGYSITTLAPPSDICGVKFGV